VERLAVREALAEFGRLAAQLLVGERLDLWLQRVHLGDDRTQAFQFAVVLSADDLGENGIDHQGRCRLGYPRIVTHKSRREARKGGRQRAGRQESRDDRQERRRIDALNSYLAALLTSCLARFGEDLKRIDEPSVRDDLVVQVRAGGAARRADIADDITALHGL